MNIGIKGWGFYAPEGVVLTDSFVDYDNSLKDSLEDYISSEKISKGLGIIKRRAAHQTENTLTMSYEAASNALKRANVNSESIKQIIIASENHPYKVNAPTELIKLLGTTNSVSIINYTNTCVSGMTALKDACEKSNSFYEDGNTLVIAADKPSAYENDALRFTISHYATAFIIGKNPVVTLEDYSVHTSNMYDFFQKHGFKAPTHMGNETSKSYKKHIINSLKKILKKGYDIRDFDYMGMHSPFPKIMEWLRREDKEPKINNPLKKLLKKEFDEKIKHAKYLGSVLGNAYPATSLSILQYILEKSSSNETILLSSFGSGASAISGVFKTHEGIDKIINNGVKTHDYLNKEEVLNPETARKRLGIIKRPSFPDEKKHREEIKKNKCSNVYLNKSIEGEVVKNLKKINPFFRKILVDTENGLIEGVSAGCKLDDGTRVEPRLVYFKRKSAYPDKYFFAYKEKK